MAQPLFSIKIDYSSHLRFRDKLGRLRAGFSKSVVAKSAEEVAIFALDKIKEEAPVDTGKLRESITLQRFGPWGFTISSDIWYGPYVRYGAAPHWVVAGLVNYPEPNFRDYRGRMFGIKTNFPRHYLHWDNVFIPYVRHKARRPNDYVERAIPSVINKIEDIAPELVAIFAMRTLG